MTGRLAAARPVSPRTEVAAGSGAAPWRRVLGGMAWVGTLAATIVLLHSLGSGPLSAPPVLDRAELRRWLDERDAVIAAFALVRLIGLALAGYLLAITVLGLAARMSRVPALVAAVDAATVPAVRRMLGAIAGVSLTASAASLVAANLLPRAPAVSEVVDRAEAPVVLERLPDRSDVLLRRVPPAAGSPVAEGRATMQLEAETVPLPPVPSSESTATMRVDDGIVGEASPREWTAAAGDHLWHMAESTLARAWGRPPTDAEVTPYWEAVVEANRARLVDPANPDLIRPGQVFTLPSVPARS